MSKKQGKLRLKSGTRVFGPMTRADLAELAAKGRLKPGDEVSYDNGPWMPADDYLRATADRPEDATAGSLPHQAVGSSVPTPAVPQSQPAAPPHAPAVKMPYSGAGDAPLPTAGASSVTSPAAATAQSAGLSGIGTAKAMYPSSTGQPGRAADPSAAKASPADHKAGLAKSGGEERNLQIIKGSRKYPPMTRSQISELLASGRVTTDDLICTVGGPWMTIEDFFSSRPVQTRSASPLHPEHVHVGPSMAAPLEMLTEADVVDPQDVLPHTTGPAIQVPYTSTGTQPIPAGYPATDYSQWPQPGPHSPWARQSAYPPEAAEAPGQTSALPYGVPGVPTAPGMPGYPAAPTYPGQAELPAAGAHPGMPGYAPPVPGVLRAYPSQVVPEVLGEHDVVGASPVAGAAGIPGFQPGPTLRPIDLDDEVLADEWCVRVRGVPSTRLQRRHIKQLLDAGEIGADAYCTHMSWPNNQWKQLKDIPQLASLLRGRS